MRALAVAVSAIVCHAAIIDRIAIVVGNRAIVDSAIGREIRITDFLNGEAAAFTVENRKQAASRLIDQELIRQQIRSGDYPVAAAGEADQLLLQIRKDRFGNSEAQLRQALQRSGITQQQLREHLLWQLTVLRFIDARFRPEVVVSEPEIEHYRSTHPVPRQTAVDRIAGERVNTLLDNWLKQARKDMRIEYLEKSLQ